MVKSQSNDGRSNVDLGRAPEFIETWLSKIDNPLKFKFTKRKESQLERVNRLNALRDYDASRDDWDIKDLAGKDQCLTYGRAIYAYYADDIDGYRAHLDNVDVYDFLIDPSVGGIDIEKARYMGRFGVVKDAEQLKDKLYIQTEVERLVDAATERTQEDMYKDNRIKAAESATLRDKPDGEKYKFWEWYTTYDGVRYYLLMQEGGACIRAEKLTDLFPATKDFPLGYWPFWSYAAKISLTEFWTPAPLDRVREIFMAQNVTINQMLDNGEEHNKPTKVVDTGAVENLAELKYKRGGGNIKVKPGFDVNKAVQFLRPPTIDTPMLVFDKLEQIQEKASGVTAGAKGLAEPDGKATIYEGNQANTADRFGLMNKSYAFGYKRFGRLYELEVRDKLTKKIAIDILGPEGVEVQTVSRRDIFRKTDEFAIIVEASDAEDAASEVDKKNKLGFLGQNSMNPVQSPKKAYEIGAKIAGFTQDEIKELMDTSSYGDAEIISEAARDIEDIIEGRPVRPNRAANLAYKQKFVDYMNDHEEDITAEQFAALALYLQSCEDYVIANTVREAEAKTMQMGALPAPEQTGGAPLQPTDIISANNAQNGNTVPGFGA